MVERLRCDGEAVCVLVEVSGNCGVVHGGEWYLSTFALLLVADLSTCSDKKAMW
jgi:hypothetical protein